MSYNKILDCLTKIHEITSWETHLIKYNHRTNPNEFTCYTINFDDNDLLMETIQLMCKNYKYVVDKYNTNVVEYSGFNPKNTVDKLSVANPIINEQWNSLIQHINISDDSTDIKDIKSNGFIFVGTYLENSTHKNIYLLGRKNPVLGYNSNRTFFTSRHNTISEAKEPLLQFPKCFDAIVYDGILYMINSNCESIFNMEYSHKLICKKCLLELSEINLIENMDSFLQYATAGHTPKKFVTYDNLIIEKLKTPQGQQHFAQVLKIPLTNSNKFDLSTETNAKNFILAICGKTKHNLFDDTLCEVPSSTPLILT